MREILRIAKTELQTMFYSPVAWFILIIFVVQSGMTFFGIIEGNYEMFEKYGSMLDYNLTAALFGSSGLFGSVISDVFMYIPLLTMGVISREISSGSMKLLYSSPLTNSQIIYGKFLGVVGFILVMMSVLLVYSIIGVVVINEVDIPRILTGLLGVFFLLTTYAAIGVYISSLTSYQIVAALGTFVVLSFFNFIGGFGQTVPFVREITYWLAMTGRAQQFVGGLICTEDLAFFLAIPFIFIYLTIARFKLNREINTMKKRVQYYGSILVFLVLVAYVSSQPSLMFFWDNTRFETNTINKPAQDIMSALDDDMTVTTYTNIYDREKFVNVANPESEMTDIKNDMERYVRFKPDMKLKYVYYYSESNPNYEASIKKMLPEDMDKDDHHKSIAARYNVPLYRLHTEKEVLEMEPSLSDEGFRTIKVVEFANGKKGSMRYFDDMSVKPGADNILSAFKRLSSLNFPKVGFVEGHDERSGLDMGGKNYFAFVDKASRSSLFNNGFDIESLLLDKPVPDDINILVIADVRKSFTVEERKNYQEYVDRGGNLMILGEPFRTDLTNELIEQFGVALQPGIIVQPFGENNTDVTFLYANKDNRKYSYMLFPHNVISSNRTTSVKKFADKGYNVYPLYSTRKTSGTTDAWHEYEQKYFDESVPKVNESANEKMEENIPVILTLDKKVGDKIQKIVICGDADIVSSGELGKNYFGAGRQANNRFFINGIFNWLSDGQSPIDFRRPEATDNGFKKLNADISRALFIIFVWLLPIALLLFAIFLTLRRRSK